MEMIPIVALQGIIQGTIQIIEKYLDFLG